MTTSSAERVLVLGATGMLGHKVWQLFQRTFDTWATVRTMPEGGQAELFPGDRIITDIRVDDFDSVVRACALARPTTIVNCVGLVKQRKAAADPLPSIAINALFPHRAAALAETLGARLIHISTDCVFSGSRGHYSERDRPDAYDLYGRTKLLGEVSAPRCLTLRTSIIGRELVGISGLAEWFLSQKGGRVSGYTQASFSGVTTIALASVLAAIVEQHPALEGVYHLASSPITKYDLLCKLNTAYRAGVEIEPSDAVRIDRTLDGSRFVDATRIPPRTWDSMIAEMAADATPYDEWRRTRV